MARRSILLSALKIYRSLRRYMQSLIDGKTVGFTVSIENLSVVEAAHAELD